MMAMIMPRIEVYMAASALSLVPVKGIFTVHIILKIVNRLFRGQLQKIRSVIQRRSVFWRTFLRFAPVQLSPFRSVRCDFLMKAMPAVRRVRQIRFCETNPLTMYLHGKRGILMTCMAGRAIAQILQRNNVIFYRFSVYPLENLVCAFVHRIVNFVVRLRA